MECKTVGSCLKRVVISKMCMNKKEDLRSAIMSRCSNILSLRGSPPLILYTIITIVILLPSACFGETVKVTTLAEVIGNDGNDVVVPCSFTVTPTPSGDQDYVLRWIKYPEGATFYNVYNYNGEGEFDGPVNSPAEGRYTRTNQDLNIPSFTLADQGKLCCEIVLLPDMTATDSNCTQVKYVDFPTDIAWKAVDKKNTSLIVNPDYYITAIPPVTLEVNISYNEIYPPCDLVLYRRTTEGGNDVLTQLDQKLQSQVTAVNGRYSLLMEAKQPVDCTGQDVITRLVARLENCLITSPQYEAEKHFTVVCSANNTVATGAVGGYPPSNWWVWLVVSVLIIACVLLLVCVLIRWRRRKKNISGGSVTGVMCCEQGVKKERKDYSPMRNSSTQEQIQCKTVEQENGTNKQQYEQEKQRFV